MSVEDVASRKQRLRKSLKASRPHNDSRLSKTLLKLVAALDARRIACYVSTPGEPDTVPFLDTCTNQGLVIAVPRIVGDTLSWNQYEGVLEPGAMGIPISNSRHVSIDDFDLLLVPALAATISGDRLGRGGGFFDKEIHRLRSLGSNTVPKVTAIVFEDELLDALPTESHDEQVDFVVTPSEIVDCRLGK